MRKSTKSDLAAPASGRPGRAGRGRRQAVSFMLAVVLAVQGLLLSPPDQAGAEPITMLGSGIEGDPYIVTSAEELEQVRHDLSAWYVLDRDITLTSDWTPIGNYYADEEYAWKSSEFTGHFDGGGHSVAGLRVDTGFSSQTEAGLFGQVGATGVIENLSLQSPSVTGSFYLEFAGTLAGKLAGTVSNVQVVGGSVTNDSWANIGGLIGKGLAGSRIENSHSSANVEAGFNGIYGGLVGELTGAAVVDSYAEGNVSAGFNQSGGGGLVGSAADSAISGSYASGGVTGGGLNGGLIGTASNTVLSNSYATGQVSAANGTYVGGLIGKMSAGEVTDSYSAGSVSGYSQVGGLVGSAEDGTAINRAYATGAIDGSGNVGGLVGDLLNSTVSLSFASGNVNGNYGSIIGGLVGFLSGSSVTDSYAAGSVKGSSQFGGLAGSADYASRIERSYAMGKVHSDWEGQANGLVGNLSGDSSVIDSFYDKTATGQSDEGRGDPKTTDQMGQESTYANWDFSAVWQLDDRSGYPGLIAFDHTPAVFKSASVSNGTSDRIDLVFQEKIAADADVLPHLSVSVDGSSVTVSEAAGFQIGDETRTLTLVISDSVKAGQTVTVVYEAGDVKPIRDLAGNRMADEAITADNLVESTLKTVQLSPADDTENVTTDTAMTILFSHAVSPAAGKRIELRKSAGGRLVETFDAADASRVTVSGNTVTIAPSAPLAPLTGYYVTVEAGAFRDADNMPSMAIADASRWNFTTAPDNDTGWVYAGNAGLSEGKASSPDLFQDNGKLYVAYVDRAHSKRVTVMQYTDDESGWTPVGTPGFTAGEASAPALFVDNGTPYVAYEQSAGADVQVAVMKFDGSGWTAVGDPLTAGEDSDPSLFVDGGNAYVAYRGAGPNNPLMAARYDDGIGSWTPMGDPDGISEGDSYTPSLAVDDGEVYLAFQDYVYPGFGATVLRYDATSDTWSVVGERHFTDDFAFDTSLVIEDGSLYVAYENLAHQAAVMKFDPTGGQWVSVGTAGFSKGQAYYTSLDVYQGEPYAVYSDEGKSDKATVMKYTGSRWAEVGSRGFSAGNAAETSIAFMHGNVYVAFEDTANGNRVSVMTYATNVAPTASGVQVSGMPAVGLTLTGSYAYNDANGDAEGASAYRWYTADDSAGSNRKPIAGASGLTLTLESDQLGKYIIFEVEPKAAAGVPAGSAVAGAAVGPVKELEYPVLAARSPAPGAAGVAIDVPLSLTFSEPVSAVSGKRLTVRKQADGSLVEEIDAANPADVSVTGATYGYRLSENLDYGTAYYVLIDAEAFRNADGVGFAGIADAADWTFATVGDNANLANLTLTGAAMTPNFRPDNVSYTANVPYSTRGVTVTASVYDIFASMTLNEQDTLSGTPVDVALHVGNNPIRVEVTAQDGMTKKLYTVDVTRARAPDEDSDPDDEQPDPDEEEPQDEGFEVIVNGQRHEQVATGKFTQEDGSSSVAVTVDSARLAAQIEGEERPSLVIPVTQSADRIYVDLAGDAIDALSRKSGVLVLQTPLGAYRIPAAELPVGELSQSLGDIADPSQVRFRVNISQGSAEQRTLLDEAAQKGSFLIAVPPVDFSVTVSYGGQSVQADRFENYVEREIPLPEGADPSGITTAVVLEGDGTVRHVPTYVTQRDGAYVAVVNSLTNSSYALILHQAEFADMGGHWAEQAVADMGSRLIVSGTGANRFDPDAPVTRAQFLSIVIRALGLSDRGAGTEDFRDIADEAWYAGAAAKAAEYGIVKGYEDGTFRPDKTITRAEAFVIIASAMKLTGLDTGISTSDQTDVLSAFSDSERVGAWAAPAAAAAVKHGLVRGYRGALHPEASLTRAEATVLLRAMLIQAGLIDNTKAR